MEQWLYLHSNREVCLGLGREEDINGFLGKGLVSLSRRAYFNDMKLGEKISN
jgi:hypothetical protein